MLGIEFSHEFGGAVDVLRRDDYGAHRVGRLVEVDGGWAADAGFASVVFGTPRKEWASLALAKQDVNDTMMHVMETA